MKKTFVILFVFLGFCGAAFTQKIPNYSPDIKLEKIGRGLVAYRSGSTIYISWRYLKTDSISIGFNIYRTTIDGTIEGERVKVNSSPVLNSTFCSAYLPISSTLKFYLREVRNGVEIDADAASYFLKSTDDGGGYSYLEIPMKQVPGDNNWIYSPNDASFADLDGDGEMEIVVHRTGAGKDNAQDGVTDAPYFQAYELDGTFLWEINLGINIREGAHYTQFMLYDLDGDGKAEFVCKTAEGGKDAAGKNIGEDYFPTYKIKFNITANYNPNANYRNGSGYILSGPEFLTVFNGETGREIVTTEYDPPRFSNIYNNGNEVPFLYPTGDQLKARWDDNYGNRVDRFLACVAYLDGKNPSLVMCRGYYSRAVLVAYDFADGKLTKKWKFDTYAGTSTSPWTSYRGQGNHNLRVGDVDGDGFDEIIYGSCAIDHNGRGLYNTRLGHGDAQHLSDYIPEHPGLEVLSVHENKVDGTTLREAATGKILFQVKSADDVGRGMGTDITSSFRGMEWWSSRTGGPRNSVNGNNVSSGGVSMNMACWWDGDLFRELQDGTNITKYVDGSASTLLSPSGLASNNSTKSNPCIVGDIIGDWREEVVLRASTNKFIRVYMTNKTTNYRFHSFLLDPVYRMSIVYQNVAYNQPTHTGFYFGSDLENIFVPTKVETATDEIVLDAVFDGYSYKWSTGDTTKKITLKSENFPANKSVPVYLDMNYLGYIFTDTVYVQFNRTTGLESTFEKGLPINLVNTEIKNDMSISFESPGLYECRCYDLSGTLLLKTNFLVNGKSIQTFDVSGLPFGMGMVVIENGFLTYRKKYLKVR